MKKRNMSGVLVLLVFAVFMVSVLLVLLSGADMVQRLTRRDQRSYHHRTAVQYITTRIRQSDAAGAVSVRSSETGDMLVLTETIEGWEKNSDIVVNGNYVAMFVIPAGMMDAATEFGKLF